METLELADLELCDLNVEEQKEITGGNPIWIGLAVGLGVKAIYDFANGMYSGIQLELANK